MNDERRTTKAKIIVLPPQGTYANAERRLIVGQLISQVYAWRADVLALRLTPTAMLFARAADPHEWLTIVQNADRSAPSEQNAFWLKRLPVLLTP